MYADKGVIDQHTQVRVIIGQFMDLGESWAGTHEGLE